MSGIKYTEPEHWDDVVSADGTWEEAADVALPILMDASPRHRREMLGALLLSVARYGRDDER